MKLAALGVLCAVMGAQLSAQTVATVAQQFQNPAKEYRPMVRWWWPGGDVTDAELRREIDLLDGRIGLECAARLGAPLGLRALARTRRCLRCTVAPLDLEPHRAAEVTCQGLRQLVLQIGRAH